MPRWCLLRHFQVVKCFCCFFPCAPPASHVISTQHGSQAQPELAESGKDSHRVGALDSVIWFQRSFADNIVSDSTYHRQVVRRALPRCLGLEHDFISDSDQCTQHGRCMSTTHRVGRTTEVLCHCLLYEWERLAMFPAHSHDMNLLFPGYISSVVHRDKSTVQAFLALSGEEKPCQRVGNAPWPC